MSHCVTVGTLVAGYGGSGGDIYIDTVWRQRREELQTRTRVTQDLTRSVSHTHSYRTRRRCTATSPPRYPELHSDMNAPSHPQTSPPLATFPTLFFATPACHFCHAPIRLRRTVVPMHHSRSLAASSEVTSTSPHIFHTITGPDPPMDALNMTVVIIEVISWCLRGMSVRPIRVPRRAPNTRITLHNGLCQDDHHWDQSGSYNLWRGTTSGEA